MSSVNSSAPCIGANPAVGIEDTACISDKPSALVSLLGSCCLQTFFLVEP